MTQQLRALAALAEDLNLVPNTHTVAQFSRDQTPYLASVGTTQSHGAPAYM